MLTLVAPEGVWSHSPCAMHAASCRDFGLGVVDDSYSGVGETGTNGIPVSFTKGSNPSTVPPNKVVKPHRPGFDPGLR